MARHLGDAVGDVVDHVDAGHALLFKQEHGLAFLFAENRNQHIGAGDFTLARALDMKDCALQYTLEAQGWLGFTVLVMHGDQWRGGVDKLLQVVFEFVEVRAAGAQNGRGGLIIQ
ncbi:hypothetical protein D3C79_643680 [compost metagenome]